MDVAPEMPRQYGFGPARVWSVGLRTMVAVLALLAVVATASPAAASTGQISGVVFADTNRNATHDQNEPVWSGKRVYLFDAAGQYLRNVTTDSSGRYAFTELASGEYRIEYDRVAWTQIWETWVPTTTGSVWPRASVAVGGAARVDLGWRTITHSTDAAAPLSTFTGPNGLRIESFNDAVTAQDVWDALARGTLAGGEAATTRIQFGLGVGDACTSSTVEQGGVHSDFQAQCRLGYLRWLDLHDAVLFHEYGHAWASYHALIARQDPDLSEYLQARGLSGDPRLGTSHAWNSGEILAEDYRQLFGSPTAAAMGQENTDIPPASAVPGLREYLETVFTQPASEPSPTPSPTPTASPSPTPTPTPSPAPSPSPSPTKTKGGGGGGGGGSCRKGC